MELLKLLETTVAGLGCALVDYELSRQNGLLRVFIEKPDAVTIDDCVRVSHQLTHVLAVEGVHYDRLEVSSPGLDRRLKSVADFVRFSGERAHVRLKHPLAGRRNFIGVLQGMEGAKLRMEVDQASVELEFADIEKARLAPDFDKARLAPGLTPRAKKANAGR